LKYCISVCLFFRVVLSAATPQVTLSELIPGSGASLVSASATDRKGNFYLAGRTASTDFPVRHAVQTVLSGPGDGFVLQIDPSGKILFATYFGGSKDESINGIAVDARGDIYITGTTTSPDLPLKHAFQSLSKTNLETGFVAKMDPSAGKLLYSTYLGGGTFDTPEAITIDPCGEAYVTGRTGSPDFPVKSPLQKYGGGYANAFVTKLAADGSALVYSTFLGGTGYDWGRAIAVDAFGRAFVTGQAQSPNFPLAHATQSALLGQQNIFLTALSPSGTALIFSTFFGGEGRDAGFGIAFDPSGNLVLAGTTNSVHFPLLQPTQPYLGGAPLYVSTDGGNTVSQYHGVITQLFSKVAFAPLQPSRIYGLTPDGFVRSDDDGSSFTVLYSQTGVTALAIDPSDPNTLYLSGARAVLKSTDGGETFTSTQVTFSAHGIIVDNFNPKHLYAWETDLFESQDGGITWTSVPNVTNVNSVTFDPKNSGVAYIGTNYLFGGSNVVISGTLIRRANGSSQVVRTGLSNMIADAVDNTGVLYLTDGVSLYKTSDSGQSFTLLANNLTSLAIDPLHNSTLYAVSMANPDYPALVKSTNSGVSFSPLSSNFHGSPITSIAIDPGNSQHLLLGSQVAAENGFIARFDVTGALLSSTYFGGSGDDEINALAVDDSGRIAIAGVTSSYDLPVSDASQPTRASAVFSDAFVALFPGFSTYLGGAQMDSATTVALSQNGHLLAGGTTASADFPLTTGPAARTDSGFLWLINTGATNPPTGRRMPGCEVHKPIERR
jgi:photosystem II stability/assembly factor-like uncharacterized protein